MKRILACLGMVMLGLSLAGCVTLAQVKSAYNTVTTAQVTQKKAALVVTLYNTAEQAAIVYLQQPPCKAGQSTLKDACRDKDIAAKMNAIMDKGDPAVDTLLADIKTAKAQGSTVPVLSTAYDIVLSSKDDLVSATPSK